MTDFPRVPAALSLYAKLRRAMVAPERALAGLVEVDEASITCRTKDDPPAGSGRSPPGKAAHRRRRRGRRRRPRPHPPGADRGLLRPQPARLPRRRPRSRRHRQDRRLGQLPGRHRHQHDPRVVGAMAAHIVLPWVHRVFSNLKTWALGVYHGLRPQHLQAYLDEFVFRFNRRRTRRRHSMREEFGKLLAAAEFPHLRLFYILAIGTLARKEAILDLTWARCDFERNLIYLRDPEQPVTNKGQEIVPMNDAVFSALQEAEEGRSLIMFSSGTASLSKALSAPCAPP